MKYPDNISAVSKLSIDYMGFIFYPKSARYIDQVPVFNTSNTIQKIGVFVNADKNSILQKAQTFGLHGVQLHGQEPAELCRQLREQGLFLLKAFGIDDSFDWKNIAPYLTAVDVLLFDTKSPQHGGTGITFNWQKLREYPYDKPYFLSGGLSVDNLEQAAQFDDDRLTGLDLNSKFELEPGLKNIDLLTQALKIIKK